MFGLILLSSGTVLHFYVFWRASSVPFIKRVLTTREIFLLVLFFWMLLFAGNAFDLENAGVLSDFLDIAGMTWVAVLFLVAVPLVVLDVITGFGVLFPAAAPRLRGFAVVVGCVFSLVALVQGVRAPAVENYEVELAGLSETLDGTVIIGLADLHLRSLQDAQLLGKIVSRVNQERPDIIVLLGDIFECHGIPSPELASGLKDLRAPWGSWAVLGNHELHGHSADIELLFTSAGIEVLRNRKIQLLSGLSLAGVDDLTSNRRRGKNEDLISKALSKPAAGVTVVLSHTPWNAERAAKEHAGLMLCGHTHGGQIWPFGYLVRLFYPLLGGRYEVDGMTVVVSRGAGSWGPPLRLWNPREIIKVTLRSSKKGG